MINVSAEELEQLSDEELEKQALAEAEGKKATAEPEEPAPDPEPDEDPSPAPEPQPEPEADVTPRPEPEPVNDGKQEKDKDPLEWAKAKGFKSPEDMARALLQKEQEFHQSRQNGRQGEPPPIQPLPSWNQRPEQGGGYPPPPAPNYQPSRNIEELAKKYDLDPEDFNKVARLNADLVRAALAQERERYDRRLFEIERDSKRNREAFRLMQDPAYTDPQVQKEMHSILDADNTHFQREGWQTAVFNQALGNLARRQLQQGTNPGSNAPKGSKPPVTAGGGNGSAFTGPRAITEREFATWTEEQQKAYLESGGKRVPRK